MAVSETSTNAAATVRITPIAMMSAARYESNSRGVYDQRGACRISSDCLVDNTPDSMRSFNVLASDLRCFIQEVLHLFRFARVPLNKFGDIGI